MTHYQAFKRRWAVVVLAFLAWAGVALYRLFDLQVYHAQDLRTRGERLHRSVLKVPGRRGNLLDCRGNLLATSQLQPSLCADPSAVEQPKETARQLAAALGRDKRWVRQIEQRLGDRERSFAYVERFVTPLQMQAIEKLALKGLFWQKEAVRTYPKQWTASHVVGFVSPQSGAMEGAESAFGSYLEGRPGSIQTLRDGKRRRIWLGPEWIQVPANGSDVELTIDQNIQFFTETALRRALSSTKAANITAIVMDPRDGAILAMASVPDFNPNFFGAFSAFQRRNRAIVDAYEPASAFKIVTVAAAVELGTVHWGQSFYCEEGGTTVHGKFIRDNKRFGMLTVEEILWHSSNVGAIKIAHTLSAQQFYDFIDRFGFGRKTGIDLPAEARGLFHPLERWSRVSPSYLSIGHEISATSLQMLRAATVVANGGFLVQPHIGRRVHLPAGGVVDIAPAAKPERVLSENTCQEMRRALSGVVLHGTGKGAQIPGLEVFGKTGTAQRLEGGGYSREHFNASFVGFFPAQQPRYGMIVVVHDPKAGKVHGGEVAAPIFSEIGRQIALYDEGMPGQQMVRLAIEAHQRPAWPTGALSSAAPETVPDLLGLGWRGALGRCTRQGLVLEAAGKGRVVEQQPAAGTPLPADRVCRVRMGAP